MSDKKPKPIMIETTKAACPVCGKASYSASGIHPQCEVARADAVFKAKLKAAASLVPALPRPPHSKQCPKCRRSSAVRRAVCECGHRFLVKAAQF